MRRAFSIKTLIGVGLVTAMLCLGCHREQLPQQVMDEDTMVSFLIDTYLLESYYATQTRVHNEAWRADVAHSYAELYARYGVTQPMVDSSMAYYCDHSERYEQICLRVRDSLNNMMTTM